jgi:Fe-S cluster biogenesis protein NfuA
MASPPCVSVAVRVSRPLSRSEVKEMDVKDRVEKALDLIRPALQNDGGDVELVDVDEAAGIVKLKLVGACGSCPMSQMTLRMGVERVLKEEIPEIVEVQAV